MFSFIHSLYIYTAGRQAGRQAGRSYGRSYSRRYSRQAGSRSRQVAGR